MITCDEILVSIYIYNNILKDINECTADPCAEYANCDNLEGSFSCTCKNGFFGNGYERCLSKYFAFLIEFLYNKIVYVINFEIITTA